MKHTDISRRKFIGFSGSILAGSGAGLLSPHFGYSQRSNLTAGEVLARIKKNVAVPWREVTVDTIKGSGSPGMVVTGITTTFMATLDVLARSVQAGNNFVLAHEPTFWTNLDLGEGLAGDPLYLHKLAYIKENNLFVHRFHDHWHARRPDGIDEGWNRIMGWDHYRFDETSHVYELPDVVTLASYAKEVKERLKSDGVRVIGDPQLPVRTVSKGSNKVPKGGAPFADLTITYEPDRENNNVEWERDIIASGQKKGFVIVSHNRLEEFGMENCADWVKTFVPEVPVNFISSGDPFWRTVFFFIICLVNMFFVTQAQTPFLRKKGTATQLIVDGKPFLVLGGELHNSTSSSLAYMAPVLANFSTGHLNTALVSVCWDLIEPREGAFDFSLVDGAIRQAREDHLRLILLWFGTWKNGVSTYPPLWVKTDLKRFPRAQNREGKSLDIISTFSDAAIKADANAFAKLMQHLRQIDETTHTVLMIQVENEVGVLSEARDRSSAANAAFTQPVPKALMDHLRKDKASLSPGLLKKWEAAGSKTSGNWEDIFGVGETTDEMFSAWQYARFVGKVAEAGKAAYPLPMFVNTWLADWTEAQPMKPGDYPSGGPLPYMMDIWKAGAPTIDILAPDIYSNFEERSALYTRPDNPLFIPELVRETKTCSAIFVALGQHDAIGFSPFGMESLPGFSEELGKTYEVLAQIAPVVLQNQGKGVINGAFLDKDHPKQTLKVGDYTLELGIARHYSFPTPEYPAGIFIQTGPDEYLIAGRGLTIDFLTNTPGDTTVRVAMAEDGTFVDGQWAPGRRLNGDETLSGKGLRLRGDYYMVQRVKLYKFPTHSIRGAEVSPGSVGQLVITTAVKDDIVRRRPVDYVNPLIGTAPLTDPQYLGNNPVPGEELYYGCVNPGAMVPDATGHLCVGPVSGFDGERYHVRGSGYRFTDTTIMGFTILNGEYHDDNKLLFMPTVGRIKTIPVSRAHPFEGYRSAKDTLQEKASPGYYTVSLLTYGIKVALTATKNCGFQRYIFPKTQEANVLIDLANSQPYAKHASVKIVDSHTIQGVQEYTVDTVFNLPGGARMYFYAVFSKDFSKAGTWKNDITTPGSATAEGNPIGAYVTFNTADGDEILVKVGTSVVSIEDARKNLQREIPGMDFNATRQQAKDSWSAILDRRVVEGGSEGERINFYTAVYRKNGYSWNGGRRQSENKTAQKPEAFKGRWGGGYWGTGSAGGVVGTYKKGFSNIDMQDAYLKLHDSAMTGGGAAGIAYRKYGYIPENAGVDDYVNRSIGLSYEDYAMSELAKIVGNDDDYRFFLERSKNYRKLYNPATGFLTPRRADGSWILPLDPFNFHAEDVYREGNAWNYLWFNIGDIPGLIDLLGGNEAFIKKLDTFFTMPFPATATALRDCTGLIGLYCHGNEQYRHIPYLYNYAGQPWKTQRLTRKIQTELYRPAPGGLCGMDDYGNMEGWYATSVLGYNEADAASGYYEIGSPLFQKTTITLTGAHPGTFIILAKNVSDINMYIQSATLNGKPLNTPRFRQNDMIPGGSLVFEMGPQPNYEWGTGK